MPTDGLSFWAVIEPPVIAVPGGVLNRTLPIVATISPFISALTTFKDTDFEIRTGPNGSGFIQHTTLVTVQGGYTIPALTLLVSTTYYVRARHRGQSGAWSGYSPEVILQT